MKTIRYFVTSLLAAAIAVLASPAFAASDFTWTPPATFENGASLDPALDLQGYRMTCASPQTGPASVEISGGLTSSIPIGDVLDPSVNANHSCAMISVATDGGESTKPSNSVEVRVRGGSFLVPSDFGLPLAPSTLVVQ